MSKINSIDDLFGKCRYTPPTVLLSRENYVLDCNCPKTLPEQQYCSIKYNPIHIYSPFQGVPVAYKICHETQSFSSFKNYPYTI
jgi:hypothetical protein